jgi:DNA (cytosine-5)-methyltransferase 1
MSEMNFISLFAGIGGFDLGLERAGMKCVAQVEIDPFCLKVLEKHWPDVPRFTDVKEVGKHNLPAADLICGGFPCQPHSVAGKRRGKEDDRDLWPEYRRIIDECRPRWVLAENVPGIRTTILDQVLSDMERLDYTTRTLVVPACAFDAPHRRERIFIIAHAKSSAGRLSELARKESLYSDGNGGNRNVAYAEEQYRPIDRQETLESGWRNPDIRNTTSQGFQNMRNITMGRCTEGNKVLQSERSDWWSVEPPVGRVAHGIPRRVDRLRSLGNAVVPQVVEWIGRQIVECDH